MLKPKFWLQGFGLSLGFNLMRSDLASNIWLRSTSLETLLYEGWSYHVRLGSKGRMVYSCRA